MELRIVGGIFRGTKSLAGMSLLIDEKGKCQTPWHIVLDLSCRTTLSRSVSRLSEASTALAWG
jgi:hypothetical protein